MFIKSGIEKLRALNAPDAATAGAAAALEGGAPTAAWDQSPMDERLEVEALLEKLAGGRRQIASFLE